MSFLFSAVASGRRRLGKKTVTSAGLGVGSCFIMIRRWTLGVCVDKG